MRGFFTIRIPKRRGAALAYFASALSFLAGFVLTSGAVTAQSRLERAGTAVVQPAGASPATAQLSDKVARYIMRIMNTYDKSLDGVLQAEEWAAMSGSPQAIDIDADRNITLDELTYHVADYGLNYWTRRFASPSTAVQPVDVNPEEFVMFQPISGPLPGAAQSATVTPDGEGQAADSAAQGDTVDTAVGELYGANSPWHGIYYRSPEELAGLPAWFIARDVDGDGQLTLLEFSPRTLNQELVQFATFDVNGDDLLTPDEVRGE